MMLCGKLGAQILSVITLIVLLMLLFGVSLKNIIIAAKKPADKFKDVASEARETRRRAVKRKRAMPMMLNSQFNKGTDAQALI